MLSAEKSIQRQNHNHSWFPGLYRAIRKVTIWWAIFTQHKTGINQQKQMQKLQNNVTHIIDTTWITVRDIKDIFMNRKKNLRKQYQTHPNYENNISFKDHQLTISKIGNPLLKPSLT